MDEAYIVYIYDSYLESNLNYFSLIFSGSLENLSVMSGNVNVSGGERHQITRVIQHKDFNSPDMLNK